MIPGVYIYLKYQSVWAIRWRNPWSCALWRLQRWCVGSLQACSDWITPGCDLAIWQNLVPIGMSWGLCSTFETPPFSCTCSQSGISRVLSFLVQLWLGVFPWVGRSSERRRVLGPFTIPRVEALFILRVNLLLVWSLRAELRWTSQGDACFCPCSLLGMVDWPFFWPGIQSPRKPPRIQKVDSH